MEFQLLGVCYGLTVLGDSILVYIELSLSEWGKEKRYNRPE